MGQSYKKNKVHIYAWIEKNKAKRNEYSRIWSSKNKQYLAECQRLRFIYI